MTAPKPPKVPNPPRQSPLRPTANATPRVRSDESIGRPEDIGRLVTPAAAAERKSTRITVDLDQATYAQLNHWLNRVTIEVNPDARRISLAQAFRAVVHVLAADNSISLVVVDQLRREGS